MGNAAKQSLKNSFRAAGSPELLLVPGLHDSGPSHWQSHWEQSLGAGRVVQHDCHRADLASWSERIVEVALRGPRDLVLVAHSFGCLAAVHAAPRLLTHLRAVMLVAPASPAKFDIRFDGLGPIDVPSLLVASRNDPWLGFGDAGELAQRWSSRLHDLGLAGHVNAESGYGPWSEGLALLSDLVDSTHADVLRHPTRSSTAGPQQAARS
ncbi:hypothetical protein DFR24_1193 [Panacagrimonas perspica]|uniref:Alpha/beta hydrolase n=1 Tax=Panacagrimonas perspica TaxID=381431 RepID=A0A4R7PE33_9GAMM|nr:alpha/beta hydrolase [Panacagrimonas perspica]TDU31811.1 hypothetical protein DFR24_1193 [Panacagrimonas perspica]THD02981.1 hypothetical protein B1810_10280 [Panacagrimonas perspica]